MSIFRSRKFWLFLLAAAVVVVAVLALNFNPATLVSSQQKKNDDLIAEQMAYHIGVQAYLYGYPVVDMHKNMHNETHKVSAGQQVYAPVNRFYRYPEIVGPDNAGNLRAPNNDTLYYSGWFDVSAEPVIIHTPDTAGRYFTIAVTNLYSEVEHIGRRTTGTDEAYFALVGPNWAGQLPEGVNAIPVESEQGWLLGRMLVEGPEDFDAAMSLVNDVWLASLSEFTPGQRPAMPREVSGEAIDPISSLDFFQVMNRALQSLPTRSGEEALMGQFDLIGVGKNSQFDIGALSKSARRGLLRALEDGESIVQAATQRTIPNYNGWMISKEIGRYGYSYMHRASVARGGYGNLPEESLYPARVFDDEGQLLDGSKGYRLHFNQGELPPVEGFWSLAAYRLTDFQLEDNELQRYSIGDRTTGLKFNSDGSLTLLIQHEKPADPEANWLPAPSGLFMMVMRLYEPSKAALGNDYLLPKLETISE
ncbi:MAG: DUF1214 domain-containing protein [Halioglobus sp.]